MGGSTFAPPARRCQDTHQWRVYRASWASRNRTSKSHSQYAKNTHDSTVQRQMVPLKIVNEHMKRCSTSLVIRNMQIKTTLIVYFAMYDAHFGGPSFGGRSKDVHYTWEWWLHTLGILMGITIPCVTCTELWACNGHGKIQYYFIPTRISTLKNTENDKCWQGCEETGTLTWYYQVVNDAGTMKTVWLFLTKLKLESSRDWEILHLDVCSH